MKKYSGRLLLALFFALNSVSLHSMWISRLRDFAQRGRQTPVNVGVGRGYQQSYGLVPKATEASDSWWNRFVAGFYPSEQKLKDIRLVQKAHALEVSLDRDLWRDKGALTVDDVNLLNAAKLPRRRLGIPQALKEEKRRLESLGVNPEKLWLKEYEISNSLRRDEEEIRLAEEMNNFKQQIRPLDKRNIGDKKDYDQYRRTVEKQQIQQMHRLNQKRIDDKVHYDQSRRDLGIQEQLY